MRDSSSTDFYSVASHFDPVTRHLWIEHLPRELLSEMQGNCDTRVMQKIEFLFGDRLPVPFSNETTRVHEVS